MDLIEKAEFPPIPTAVKTVTAQQIHMMELIKLFFLLFIDNFLLSHSILFLFSEKSNSFEDSIKIYYFFAYCLYSSGNNAKCDKFSNLSKMFVLKQMFYFQNIPCLFGVILL